MSAAAVNPYEISMEELAALAANQPLPAPEPKEGQPRDEHGRFIAAEPEPEVEVTPEGVTPEGEVPEGTEPVEEYTATIDIGDGAGVQIFSAPTKDELLEKLIEAQTNATRKIRELNARPTVTAPAPAPTAPNPDEEMALAQEFLSTPSAAFDKLYQRKFGETPEQTKARLERADKAAQEIAVNTAATQFIAATPDYNNSESNNRKMERWITLNQLPVTVENLQKAYVELNADGLLAPKATAPAAPAPRSSGLSTRRSAVPVTTPQRLDKLREAYTMPIEKLRELAESGATF